MIWCVINHTSHLMVSITNKKTGVPIGSPMTGVLAELVIRFKKERVIPRLTLEIKLYRRYVDICII